jgi:hypothetical protein
MHGKDTSTFLQLFRAPYHNLPAQSQEEIPPLFNLKAVVPGDRQRCRFEPFPSGESETVSFDVSPLLKDTQYMIKEVMSKICFDF